MSGLLLIVFVLLHGWLTYFAQIGDFEAGLQDEVVVFEVVKRRLAQGLFVALDFALLATVLYHGLNGIRNILLEWRPTARRERATTLALWVVGLVAFGYGARALLVFIL